MHLLVEPKDVSDAYSTPIVQQTSFWSRVKANLGMRSKAFEFSVRNSDLYTTWAVGHAPMRTLDVRPTLQP